LAAFAYLSLTNASTASDVKSKAALRHTIAVSLASAGRPRARTFGGTRRSSVGLLAGIIGNSGFMSADYNSAPPPNSPYVIWRAALIWIRDDCPEGVPQSFPAPHLGQLIFNGASIGCRHAPRAPLSGLLSKTVTSGCSVLPSRHHTSEQISVASAQMLAAHLCGSRDASLRDSLPSSAELFNSPKNFFRAGRFRRT